MKKRIVLLAAHEPELDPRIDWIARFAAKSYHVHVFGLADPRRSKPTREERNGYRITRCEYTPGGKAEFLIELLKTLVPSKLLRWVVIGTVGLIGTVLLPLAVLGEILCRFGRSGFRLLTVRAACAVLSQLFQRVWPLHRQPSRFLVIAQTAVHFFKSAKTFYVAVRQELKPDVIHANDLNSLLGGVVLKRILRCTLIYDAHEFFPYSDPHASRLEIILWKFYENRLVKHVDAAFTVNPLLAEQMQLAYGIPFGSVPNCEPLHHNQECDGVLDSIEVKKVPSHPVPSILKSRVKIVRDLSDDRIQFLFQGNFAPERGLEELIRAWVEIDSDRAVLCLRGPDSLSKSKCIALAEELNLLDRAVIFSPPVSEGELVEAAAHSDVGIIPYLPIWVNYRFSCPNKLSQYMKAGLAILSNDLDFVRSVIDTHKCGLSYDSRDAATIQDAVRKLTEDEPFRKSCQDNARSGAIADFHWEKQSEPLYRAYSHYTGIP